MAGGGRKVLGKTLVALVLGGIVPLWLWFGWNAVQAYENVAHREPGGSFFTLMGMTFTLVTGPIFAAATVGQLIWFWKEAPAWAYLVAGLIASAVYVLIMAGLAYGT